jgi:hypothetical protein
MAATGLTEPRRASERGRRAARGAPLNGGRQRQIRGSVPSHGARVLEVRIHLPPAGSRHPPRALHRRPRRRAKPAGGRRSGRRKRRPPRPPWHVVPAGASKMGWAPRGSTKSTPPPSARVAREKAIEVLGERFQGGALDLLRMIYSDTSLNASPRPFAWQIRRGHPAELERGRSSQAAAERARAKTERAWRRETGSAPVAPPFPRGSPGRRCSINATPLLAPKRDPAQSQIDRPKPIAAPPESGEAADRDGGANKTTTEKAVHPARSALLGNRPETRDELARAKRVPRAWGWRAG